MTSNSRAIAWFLLIAFGGAWISWIVPKLLGIHFTGTAFKLAILPGAFAPAIAALVVCRFVTREGFGSLGLKPHLRRWPFYLLAMLFVPVVVLVLAALVAWTDVSPVNLSVQHGLERLSPADATQHRDVSLLVLVLSLLLNSLITMPLLFGEELGWRGFLQPRWFAGSPMRSAIVTGVVWGLWHLPLNLTGYNFPVHPVLGSALFCISTVFISMIYGWLRAATGSVWAPCLAHATFNTFGGTMTLFLFTDNSTRLWTGMGGVLAWIPLGALGLSLLLIPGLRRHMTYRAGSPEKAASAADAS